MTGIAFTRTFTPDEALEATIAGYQEHIALLERRIAAYDGKIICIWAQDEDPDCELWTTACGEQYQMMDAAKPAENGIVFCPHCGALVVTK